MGTDAEPFEVSPPLSVSICTTIHKSLRELRKSFYTNWHEFQEFVKISEIRVKGVSVAALRRWVHLWFSS